MTRTGPAQRARPGRRRGTKQFEQSWAGARARRTPLRPAPLRRASHHRSESPRRSGASLERVGLPFRSWPGVAERSAARTCQENARVRAHARRHKRELRPREKRGERGGEGGDLPSAFPVRRTLRERPEEEPGLAVVAQVAAQNVVLRGAKPGGRLLLERLHALLQRTHALLQERDRTPNIRRRSSRRRAAHARAAERGGDPAGVARPAAAATKRMGEGAQRQHRAHLVLFLNGRSA